MFDLLLINLFQVLIKNKPFFFGLFKEANFGAPFSYFSKVIGNFLFVLLYQLYGSVINPLTGGKLIR